MLLNKFLLVDKWVFLGIILSSIINDFSSLKFSLCILFSISLSFKISNESSLSKSSKSFCSLTDLIKGIIINLSLNNSNTSIPFASSLSA